MTLVGIFAVALLGFSEPAWSEREDALAADQASSSLQGQGPAEGYAQEQAPVRVVLVQTLDKDDAKAMVVRAGSGQSLDAIFVTAATTPTELARAFTVLLRARERGRPRDGGEVRAYIGASANRNTPNTRYSDTALKRVRAAPERPLMRHGNVRYIIVPIISGASLQ